ncbi:TPA: hypothetical protein L1V39_003422 [Escherichia coli]|nr:hypothetical protein [Escherichia coli]
MDLNVSNAITQLANAISSIGCNKKERKIPQMKGKKRKYSQTTGTKSMVTPVFATLIFD